MDLDKVENEIKENTKPEIPSIVAAPAVTPVVLAAAPVTLAAAPIAPATAPTAPVATPVSTGTATPTLSN